MDSPAEEIASLLACFDPRSHARYISSVRYVEGERPPARDPVILYEVGWEPFLQAATPHGHPEQAVMWSRLRPTVWTTHYRELALQSGHCWAIVGPSELPPRRQVQALLGLRGDFARIDEQHNEARELWAKTLANRAIDPTDPDYEQKHQQLVATLLA